MSATGRIQAHLSTALGPWSVGVRAGRSEGAASGRVSSLVAHRDIPTRDRPEWSQFFLGMGLPHWYVAFTLYISKHVLKCLYVLSVLRIFVTGWLMAHVAPVVARAVAGLMCTQFFRRRPSSCTRNANAMTFSTSSTRPPASGKKP